MPTKIIEAPRKDECDDDDEKKKKIINTQISFLL
jgi:hypothetical protein